MRGENESPDSIETRSYIPGPVHVILYAGPFETQRNGVFRQSDAPDHYGTKSAQSAELLCLGMDCFKSAFTRRNSHLLQIQDAADRTKTNRSCEVLAIHSGLQGAVISHTLASAWGMREKVLGWS